MDFNNGKVNFNISEILYRLVNKWTEMKIQYIDAQEKFPTNQFTGASWLPLRRSNAVLHEYPWKITQYYTEDQINNSDQKVAEYCRNYMILKDFEEPLRKISFWIFYIFKIQYLHFTRKQNKREIMEDFQVKNFVLVPGNEVFKMFLKDCLTDDEYKLLEGSSFVHHYMQFHDNIVEEEIDFDDAMNGKENKEYLIRELIPDITFMKLD